MLKPRCAVWILIALALLSLGAGRKKPTHDSEPWKGTRTYGWEMMTRPERIAYRREMASYKTYEEQLAFWRSHVARMKQRAWDRGLVIKEPPEVIALDDLRGSHQPIYARDLMTSAEVEQYRKEIRHLGPTEREAYKRAHEKKMKQRGWDRGLAVPPTDAEREIEEQKADARIAARHAEAERINKELADLYKQLLEKEAAEQRTEAPDDADDEGDDWVVDDSGDELDPRP